MLLSFTHIVSSCDRSTWTPPGSGCNPSADADPTPAAAAPASSAPTAIVRTTPRIPFHPCFVDRRRMAAAVPHCARAHDRIAHTIPWRHTVTAPHGTGPDAQRFGYPPVTLMVFRCAAGPVANTRPRRRCTRRRMEFSCRRLSSIICCPIWAPIRRPTGRPCSWCSRSDAHPHRRDRGLRHRRRPHAVGLFVRRFQQATTRPKPQPPQSPRRSPRSSRRRSRPVAPCRARRNGPARRSIPLRSPRSSPRSRRPTSAPTFPTPTSRPSCRTPATICPVA